jgi:hypothetical protein
MLDLLGILFSTVAVLVVIVRAIQRDCVQPWFQPVRPAAEPAATRRAGTGAWRRS